MLAARPTRTETVVASGSGITITSVSVTPEERQALNTGGAQLPSLVHDSTSAKHKVFARHSELLSGLKDGENLDADSLAKMLCDIAYHNGWILTYKLEKTQ